LNEGDFRWIILSLINTSWWHAMPTP